MKSYMYAIYLQTVCIYCILSDNTPVRLRGGPSPFEGRIEVYYNGSWGSVCDKSFDNKDAIVICRMIGVNDRYVLYK